MARLLYIVKQVDFEPTLCVVAKRSGNQWHHSVESNFQVASAASFGIASTDLGRSCRVDVVLRRGCHDGCVKFLPQLYFHRGSLAHTPCPVVLRRSLVKTCANVTIQQVDQQMRFHTTRLLNTWIVLFVCRRSVNIVS